MYIVGLIATTMYIATRRTRLEAREAGFLVFYKMTVRLFQEVHLFWILE